MHEPAPASRPRLLPVLLVAFACACNAAARGGARTPPPSSTDPAPGATTDPAPAGTTDPAPIATTDPAPAGTTDPATPTPAPVGFVHPGLLHGEADFQRMREKVAAGASPWIDGWKLLVADGHASLSYVPRPVVTIYRNDGVHPDNVGQLVHDVAAAYACALRWKITGDTAYADKAVEIMNAWSSTLTGIAWSDGRYDGFLAAGLQGFQLANVGEIMRTYPGLASGDFARFKTMMRDVFYAMNKGMFTTPSSVLVYSNWDLCAMASAFAIGVLCDDPTIVDDVITYFRSGLGNGAAAMLVSHLHPGKLGQTQEAGRDQGHDTLSIGLVTTLCEMAWHQGIDLYGHDDNRVLAAAEYVADGNVAMVGTTAYPTMPFATYTNGNVTFTAFATGSQGIRRPAWTAAYHHYVNRRGLSAPFTRRALEAVGVDGYGGTDQLGWTALTETLDPIAAGAPPSGLVAHVSQGQVELSWWGSAYATGYAVQRGTAPGGPYATIASGITEPRTFTDAPGAGTFYYVVTATTAAGDTAASNEARAITAVQLHTHLAFDEGAGLVAADGTSSGHAGTLVGGATWAAGRTGSAVSLDGITGHVRLPDDVVLDLADCTIAAWVKWGGASAWQRVFDLGTGTGQYLYLTPRAGTGRPRFAITTNLRVGEQAIDGAAALPTGQWVHVAVTISGTVGTLYVDGVAVGERTDLRLAPFRLGHTRQSWIGRSQYAADPYFAGLVDDFRIYTGALTAREVAALAAM